jgi:hypothetical protein
MRDGDRLVGVFLAIYSDQVIEGRTERVCNPHSWCVLDEYRTHGIGLLLTLLKQPGYHFTMLTPNPRVAQIFRQLRFRDLADGVAVLPNFPSLRILQRGAIVESDRERIAPHLSGQTRRDFELHRDIRWLEFAAFGTPGDICLVAYKPARWRRLPCARLIFVSDPTSFDRHRSLLHHTLLVRHGFAVSQAESRFLSRVPLLALRSRRGQAKLFLSRTLTDSQIQDLYSELVALDI